MNMTQLFSQGDALTKVVATLLLLMSVASWVVIFWKGWLLRRALGDVARSTAAFWQAASMEDAQAKVAAFDRESLVLPLINATQLQASPTLGGAGNKAEIWDAQSWSKYKSEIMEPSFQKFSKIFDL